MITINSNGLSSSVNPLMTCKKLQPFNLVAKILFAYSMVCICFFESFKNQHPSVGAHDYNKPAMLDVNGWFPFENDVYGLLPAKKINGCPESFSDAKLQHVIYAYSNVYG